MILAAVHVLLEQLGGALSASRAIAVQCARRQSSTLLGLSQLAPDEQQTSRPATEVVVR
jgi:hypothetical protein